MLAGAGAGTSLGLWQMSEWRCVTAGGGVMGGVGACPWQLFALLPPFPVHHPHQLQGASCGGEGEEVSPVVQKSMGNTPGLCQLRDLSSSSFPASCTPFKTSHLVFEPSCHSHKSVDPFFVLPKDLATWLTRRHLLVHFFIHYSCS